MADGVRANPPLWQRSALPAAVCNAKACPVAKSAAERHTENSIVGKLTFMSAGISARSVTMV